jgi:hypothetical protein
MNRFVYLHPNLKNQMSRDQKLKEDYDKILTILADKFGDGEKLNVDAIIYLIGIQELGQGAKEFKKDDKVNLMHIAICRLLEPFGYYEFDYYDEDGWPHYKVLETLPSLKSGEQTVLIKEAIVLYFKAQELI